jgi:hypothetical protein
MFTRVVTVSASLLFGALLAVTLNSVFLAILVLVSFFATLSTSAGSQQETLTMDRSQA